MKFKILLIFKYKNILIIKNMEKNNLIFEINKLNKLKKIFIK